MHVVQFVVHVSLMIKLLHSLGSYVGRLGVVCIGTRYELEGPGLEFGWGARFSAPVQTGPGAQPASYTMVTGSFAGVKRPKRGIDNPPPSSAEVKERVELYTYSPSGLS
jgi:hypothetical protein